jgi:hypothetical protein
MMNNLILKLKLSGNGGEIKNLVCQNYQQKYAFTRVLYLNINKTNISTTS